MTAEPHAETVDPIERATQATYDELAREAHGAARPHQPLPAGARALLRREAAADRPDERRGRRAGAAAPRRPARHREVRPRHQVQGRAEDPRRRVLRVPADALHRAVRGVRPDRHRGAARGPLPAPRARQAADRAARVPRRDLQGELGDPELAAHRHQRAQVLPGRPAGARSSCASCSRRRTSCPRTSSSPRSRIASASRPRAARCRTSTSSS